MTSIAQNKNKLRAQESTPTKGKRLVLCLDGTWNDRNDSTNIFHLYTMIGDIGLDGKPQITYYDEGVGTHWWDKITGGLLGTGLDENIRQAYAWLIENYNEGDEIFVFGFSRGAFTARSLSSLLSSCGLLRPGSPLTIRQLFEAYSKMRPSKGWLGLMQRVFGIGGKDFRPFYELLHLKYEVKKMYPSIDLEFYLPSTERWLLKSTRSVHIKFLGVFDTVGSMGLDAFGIFWLLTGIWSFHNANPSRVVEHGFQALAIDEHRKNFSHITWNKFIPDESERKTNQTKTNEPDIHQRWFVGAHANIGGGYSNNPLCLFPLSWMMESAEAFNLGFTSKIIRPSIEDCLPLTKGSQRTVRDSYKEFVWGLWSKLPFTQRHYREISPLPKKNVRTRYGEVGMLKSYDETLDPSVKQFWDTDSSYRPLNLEIYFNRLHNETKNDK